jgi:hypothetical protein
MVVCVGIVIYVYLEYGLRLGLKKGGIYHTLKARQQLMNQDECKPKERGYKAPDQYFDFHKEA